MRRIAFPFILVGCGQWLAIAWWWFVDGIDVQITLGVMFNELLGLTPRVAWEPAERLLERLLDVSPGTVFLIIGLYILSRQQLARLMAGRLNGLHVHRQRQDLLKRPRRYPGTPAV